MEIIIGKTAGFCAGVGNAVKRTTQETKNSLKKNIYCLGDLVHNTQVVEELESNGLKIIQNIKDIKNPDGKKIIFRAHGVTKDNYEYARKHNMQIIDLTCGNVAAIHKLVEKYTKEGYYIFLIGEKKHPEVIGTKSFCKGNCDIIEEYNDLKLSIENAIKSKRKKILVVAQTTFNLEKFNLFVAEIKEKLIDLEIVVKNTICNATKIRQEETVKIAQNVDFMIIIGGKKSANTNKLYEISNKFCTNVIKIETAEELTNEILNKIRENDKIGIMAGASTPQEVIDDVKEKIEGK